MRRTALALVAAAALMTSATPAMAAGAGTCSFLNEVSQMVGGGPIDSVIAKNCSTPPSNSAPTGGGPTVATSEPLAVLAVGLGLVGARLLRRRS